MTMDGVAVLPLINMLEDENLAQNGYADDVNQALNPYE